MVFQLRGRENKNKKIVYLFKSIGEWKTESQIWSCTFLNAFSEVEESERSGWTSTNERGSFQEIYCCKAFRFRPFFLLDFSFSLLYSPGEFEKGKFGIVDWFRGNIIAFDSILRQSASSQRGYSRDYFKFDSHMSIKLLSNCPHSMREKNRWIHWEKQTKWAFVKSFN